MALHLNIFESHSSKDTLCQVWLKLDQWFWRRFLKVVNLFLLFPNYLPFGKGMALHLNKFESPSSKNTLCQVWLKLDQWFWRRRFWEGLSPSFEQTWIPFIKGYFVPSLVETGPVVLEYKMKMWKVYRQIDRQTTDDRWSEKLTWWSLHAQWWHTDKIHTGKSKIRF